jgi:NADPH-dependent curcumin reductase CurA
MIAPPSWELAGRVLMGLPTDASSCCERGRHRLPSRLRPARAHAGNRRFVLARRVDGLPRADDFRLETASRPLPGEGQVLVRNRFISVDPGTRGRLGDRETYAQPLALGEVIQAATVGTVETSANPRFKPGDWVAGAFGWQEWGLSDGRGLRAVPSNGLPPSTAIGVLGIPGLTAYFGLLDVGALKAGETLLVTSAAGAVGSAAGQIGRIEGARVVGVAGGPGQVRLADARPGVCRRDRLPRAGRPRRGAGRGLPRGHRRAVRQCRQRDDRQPCCR